MFLNSCIVMLVLPLKTIFVSRIVFSLTDSVIFHESRAHLYITKNFNPESYFDIYIRIPSSIMKT